MTKINLEYLNELSGGDPDFVAAMLKTYIEETAKDIESLKEAFENEDTGRVSFWAHKIKASFRMLGLNRLADTAEQLELKTKSNGKAVGEFQEDYTFILENASGSFRQAKRLVEDI